MEKKDGMPLWVFLAFSSIETRKGALILIWASAVFTLYCLPWSVLFEGQDWLGTIFLIEDWSWVAMMVPMTAWYWLSMRWVDNKIGWGEANKDS